MKKKVITFVLAIILLVGNIDTGSIAHAANNVKEPYQVVGLVRENVSEILWNASEEGTNSLENGTLEIEKKPEAPEESASTEIGELAPETFKREDEIQEQLEDFEDNADSEEMQDILGSENAGSVAFAGGDGSEENPYQIATAEQLDAVRNNLEAHYVQIADIDLSGWNWEPIGYSYIQEEEGNITTKYVKFSGSYNGNGYIISNLTIKRDNCLDSVIGLFGESEGNIENVSVENCNIDIYCNNEISAGVFIVGGIVGDSWNKCWDGASGEINVLNCTISGDIRVRNAHSVRVGGITGIGNCNDSSNYANIYVESVVYGDCAGEVICGGITGGTNTVNTVIKNCMNYGNITITADSFLYCGGICGQHGEINNCFNYGDITGNIIAYRGYRVSDGPNVGLGGIIGETSSDSGINKSINYGNISCSSLETMENRVCVGGIAGALYSSRIADSYNYGKNITCEGVYNVGRIVGGAFRIINCYSIATTLVNGVIPTENIGHNQINGATIGAESDTQTEIKFGKDSHSFGNPVSGYSGDIITAVLLLNSDQYTVDDLALVSSDNKIFEVNSIEKDMSESVTADATEQTATVHLKMKETGTADILITAPDGTLVSVPVTSEEAKGGEDGIDVRSSDVYIGEVALAVAQVSNDGSFSESGFEWTSSNKNIISIVSVEEACSLGDAIYFYIKVKGEGMSSGEARITITFSDGRRASCLVKNLGNKPKTEKPFYQVQEKKEGYELLQDYGNKWTEAYNEYIAKVNKALKKYASSDAGKQEMIIASKAKEMKQNDSTSRSKYLNFATNFPNAWKDSAYNALAKFLCDNTCSKMDFGNNTNSLSIVNTVFKSLSNASEKYEYGNVVMEVECFQFSGTKLGTITCYNKKEPQKRYRAEITSTVSECRAAISSYYKELSNLENAAIYNVYTAVAQDILGESISKFTEKWLKARINKYAAQLNMAGVGDLCNDLITCNKYYQFVGKIVQGDMASADKLIGTIAGLKFEDTTIVDRLAKKAAKNLDKAGKELYQAYIDYINGNLKENILQRMWRTILCCPISVTVWNSNGEQIGYVGDDDIWYTNTIYMEERGDAVIVDSYTDEKISFIALGTDYGMMNCSVEEYDKGSIPIGRMNFYDIPLDPGTSVSLALPDTLAGNMDSLWLISSDGENIPADEYISVSQDGCVAINCSIETNDGISGDAISGEGIYVRGDAAVLTAIPQSGHRFIGWYEDDVLLTTSEIYEFMARDNLNLKAVFAGEQEMEDEGYSISGEVSGFGEENEEVLVQLISSNGIVTAETQVKGRNAQYVLENVFAGGYILRACKKNHVTRDYPITVTADSTTQQNMELWLVGDVSGDGRVNARDKKMVYNHIAGTSPLEGYPFSVGDVTGDGRINARDKKMLYNHIAGNALLWN